MSKYPANVSEGKNIKRLSLRETGSWEWHKSVGTTGQDSAKVGDLTPDGFAFTAPCPGGVRVPGSGRRLFDSANQKYFVMEAFHHTIYGIKFTEYLNHTENRKAGAPGDEFDNHGHANYQLGHLTMDEAYNGRNSSMSFEQMDQYITEHKSSNTTPPPTKTVKGYSFNECYGYHPTTNEKCWFDIELYGSTQDDICFNLSNLTKNSDGTYTLKAGEDSYVAGTKFRKIKTTFYTDGTKSTGSSSTAPAKHKYRRTHGDDQGYYEIEDKYMNGLTVKGTTSEKHPCKYSIDNKSWSSTNVVGTTTMDVKL